MSDLESISPAVRSLLELFEAEFAEVRFPDMDLDVLRRAVEQVKDKREELVSAEAVASAVRAALDDEHEALLVKAQRALSYLRVYAEEDAGLCAKLEPICLPRAPRKLTRPAPAADFLQVDHALPRRRGRPPKSRPNAQLFAPEATEAPAEPSA